MKNPFKWRQFQPETNLLTVRWCLRYSLSFRDAEEMMAFPIQSHPFDSSVVFGLRVQLVRFGRDDVDKLIGLRKMR